jgi:membrane associated rhomboid family serine protease
MEDIEFHSEEVEVHLGKVTTALILICLLVYLTPLSIYLAPLPFLSSLVHANFFHLFYNLLNIFIFGNLVELRFGQRFTLILLMFSVAVSDVTFRLMYPGVIVVGISDYIYALIAAAFVLMPKARVLLPIGAFAIPVPVRIAAPLLAAGEFLLNFVAADNVAHISHFAGFVVGVAVALFHRMENRAEKEERERLSEDDGF